MSAGRRFYSQIIQVEIGDVIKPSVRCNQFATITPPSSLLRAHAPHPIPLAGFVSLYPPVCAGLTSPCEKKVVPDVISACLSLDAWPPTPAARWVPLPITSPTPSAFPKSLWVGLPRNSAQRLLSGGDFGAAGIH